MRAIKNHASRKTLLKSTVAGAVLCASAALAPAMADEAAPAADPSAIKFTALIETGATFANTSKGNNVNYGHLLTDKTDQLLLNQASLTLNKDLDPKAEGFDWGFKLQGFYGSDARYTHFVGLWDHNTSDRNQFDITEANLLAHLPVLTEGGIDAKVGFYSTPIGAEVIAASGNYLYSHSYIFNFALPLKHTGGYLTTHVNSTLDIITGADTGFNETFGARGTVNHGGPSALAGFGLNNLMDGQLTILALGHFGAQAPGGTPNGTAKSADHGRYLYDVVATYKPTDTAWTFITEGAYVREDAATTTQANAHAFGLAQYGIYAWNSWLSLVGRAEVFADKQNYFVAAYPGNRDPILAARGMTLDQNSIAAASGATYGSLTLGANITIPDLPERLTGTMLRPELRWDSTLNGVGAYNGGTSTGQFTAGVDLVLPVSIF